MSCYFTLSAPELLAPFPGASEQQAGDGPLQVVAAIDGGGDGPGQRGVDVGGGGQRPQLLLLLWGDGPGGATAWIREKRPPLFYSTAAGLPGHKVRG